MSFARRASALVLIAAVALSAAGAHAEDEEENPGWKGKIALGGSVSAGNVDAIKGAGEIRGERAWDLQLVRLALLASYGQTDDADDGTVVNSDKQSLSEYYRYGLTERFYLYGDALQARDSVQDIDGRILLNVGPGYQFWKHSDEEFLEGELGVGYRYENYADDTDRNDVTGRAAFLFSDLFGPAEFTQSGEFLLPFNDVDAWLARGRTNLAFPLVESWSFNNTLITEYLADPVPGNQGFDLEYIVSLSYEF